VTVRAGIYGVPAPFFQVKRIICNQSVIQSIDQSVIYWCKQTNSSNIQRLCRAITFQ